MIVKLNKVMIMKVLLMKIMIMKMMIMKVMKEILKYKMINNKQQIQQ